MVKVQLLPGALVLLRFLVCVNAGIGDTGCETVAVFKSDKTEVLYKGKNGKKIKNRNANSFRIPALVGGVLNNKEFLGFLCDARHDWYFGSSVTEPIFRTSYGNFTKWSPTNNFTNETPMQKKNAILSSITAVVKEDKIYALATIFDNSKYLLTILDRSATVWDTVMFVGTVVNLTDVSDDDNVTIIWEKETSLKSLLPENIFNVPAVYFVGGVGNGVVMKNGAIVFPVQIVDIKEKSLSSIIYSNDNGFTWRMGGTTPFYSSESSVTEFGNNKLLLSVRFNWKVRAVFESDNMGKTWQLSPIFMGIWENDNEIRSYSESKRNFVTVSVDGKDVWFFLHPLSKNGEKFCETLQLWMSDEKRIVYIGTISLKNHKAYNKNSFLAYVGNNLYIMHEIRQFAQHKNSDNKLEKLETTIALSPLQELFECAKKTVREWRKLDKSFESKGIPADGLVGYLGNSQKANNTVWEDMYNCVNATVKGGRSVEGGFRFNGKYESGAKWPVISHEQNQVNRFTLGEFTLAATVIIHSVRGAKNVTLLGASEDADKNKILIGIGYTEEKKWYTVNGNNSKTFTEFFFELKKEYHVALTFANGMAFVYVNGLNITRGTQTTFFLSWVDHFVMGKVKTELTAKRSFCTVKNVMLFNRSLEQKEIA